jgi:hypothetical protein
MKSDFELNFFNGMNIVELPGSTCHLYIAVDSSTRSVSTVEVCDNHRLRAETWIVSRILSSSSSSPIKLSLEKFGPACGSGPASIAMTYTFTTGKIQFDNNETYFKVVPAMTGTVEEYCSDKPLTTLTPAAIEANPALVSTLKYCFDGIKSLSTCN